MTVRSFGVSLLLARFTRLVRGLFQLSQNVRQRVVRNLVDPDNSFDNDTGQPSFRYTCLCWGATNKFAAGTRHDASGPRRFFYACCQ